MLDILSHSMIDRPIRYAFRDVTRDLYSSSNRFDIARQYFCLVSRLEYNAPRRNAAPRIPLPAGASMARTFDTSIPADVAIALFARPAKYQHSNRDVYCRIWGWVMSWWWLWCGSYAGEKNASARSHHCREPLPRSTNFWPHLGEFIPSVQC